MKGKKKIFLISLILCIIGLIIYFKYPRKSKPVVQTSNTTPTSNTTSTSNATSTSNTTPISNEPEIIIKSVKCLNDTTNKIYGLSNTNTIHYYPNQDIAFSWDPNWKSAQTTECSDYTKGIDMKIKINIGDPIKCSDDSGSSKVYRVTSKNIINEYPNPIIASTWDTTWESSKTIDCSDYTKGSPMNYKTNIGETIKCSDDSDKSKFYRVTSENMINQYPDKDIASSWNPKWDVDLKTIDCSGYAKGDPLKYKSNIGDSVKCVGDTVSNKIYRVTGENTLRYYPNQIIASSWNPNWADFKLIDCTGFTKGEAMT